MQKDWTYKEIHTQESSKERRQGLASLQPNPKDEENKPWQKQSRLVQEHPELIPACLLHPCAGHTGSNTLDNLHMQSSTSHTTWWSAHPHTFHKSKVHYVPKMWLILALTNIYCAPRSDTRDIHMYVYTYLRIKYHPSVINFREEETSCRGTT